MATSHILVSLVLILTGIAAPGQAQSSSIEGQVLDVTTGAPISNVRIELIGPPGTAVQATESNAGGEFSFRGLVSGEYRIVPEREGYIDTETQANLVHQGPRRIMVGAQQIARNVRLLMGKAGVISGRISDEVDSPVEGTLVSVYQEQFEALRMDWMWIAVDTVSTDDRGEFRIFGLLPGRYVLSATPMPPLEATGRTITVSDQGRPRQLDVETAIVNGFVTRDEVREGYAPVFFPNANNPTQATELIVNYGTEIRLNDVELPRRAAYSLSGRVIGATGQSEYPTLLSVTSREMKFAEPFRVSRGDNGTFEFRYVPPGTYDVTALVAMNQPPPPTPVREVGPAIPGRPPLPPARPPVPTRDENRLIGHAEITVVDEHVGNVVLVPRAFRVQGTVRSRDGTILPPGLRIELRSPVPLLTAETVPVDEFGGFVLEPVGAGEFNLIVRGLTEGWYVESARLDGIDALNATFRLERNPSGNLDIVLAQSSSTLAVRVEPWDMDSSAFVAAVPEPQLRHRIDLYRTGWADDNGTIEFNGIVPGTYTVLAWEQVANYAWLNSEVLRNVESKGRVVRVEDSESERVVVVPIR